MSEPGPSTAPGGDELLASGPKKDRKRSSIAILKRAHTVNLDDLKPDHDGDGKVSAFEKEVWKRLQAVDKDGDGVVTFSPKALMEDPTARLDLAGVALGVAAWFWASPQGSSFEVSLGLSLAIMLGGLFTAVPLLMFAIAARRMDYSVLGFVQFLAPSIAEHSRRFASLLNHGLQHAQDFIITDAFKHAISSRRNISIF